jgi:RNA polymerase sigma factor (sigma-70 family)
MFAKENSQDGIGNNADEYQEYQSSTQEHPTPEQAMLRQAIEQALMTKQRKVWEMYNYDRLTFVEIAKKMKVSESAIRQQVNTIEKQLTKWIQEHQEVYLAIKEAEADSNDL